MSWYHMKNTLHDKCKNLKICYILRKKRAGSSGISIAKNGNFNGSAVNGGLNANQMQLSQTMSS